MRLKVISKHKTLWNFNRHKNVKKGQSFLTIKGKNNNGAKFVTKALKKVLNILFLLKILKNKKTKL